MIPRLHARGKSFKGACKYILHDVGQTTDERVTWSLTCNLNVDAKHAWYEMYDTHRNQAALKANAGLAAVGRKNNAPVLHYTLSWAASDAPTDAHMKETALSSLRYLDLSEHETVIAAHRDKEHLHIHIVVNTVHPYHGRTAALKFPKLQLSRWAEAYEKEHGIHCEERVQNNEERRKLAALRESEIKAILMHETEGKPLPKISAYVPVGSPAPPRRKWLERKEVIDRMKALRADLDQTFRGERDSTWARQSKERNVLDKGTAAEIDRKRGILDAVYKPKWRSLYTAQKREERHVRVVLNHPLARAVYVFANRARLGPAGGSLSMRQMAKLILNGDKLVKRVAVIQNRERSALATAEKHDFKRAAEPVWQQHRSEFAILRDRQAYDRQAEKTRQGAARKDISFAMAKAAILKELEAIPPEPRSLKVVTPLPAPLKDIHPANDIDIVIARGEQIRRDMEGWRRRHPGRDHGREM